MGEVRELNPGDWLYPHVQVRSYMLVEAGLTGRIVATAYGQSGAGAMALSTPMRNAAGNLNCSRIVRLSDVIRRSLTCVCEKFRIVKRSLF